MKRSVTLGILMVLALAACGGTEGAATEGAAPTTTAEATTTAEEETTASSSTRAAVPRACKDAMAAYHDALVAAGQTEFPPNEERLQRRTLQSCTREEWLEGVIPYTEGDYAIAMVDPEKVLDAMCGEPRSTALACR